MMRDGKTVMLALSVYINLLLLIAFALRSTPTIPEDMRAAADNWNHFEEVTDRIRRENDPRDPLYRGEPYAEEKKWPLLSEGNQPKEGECANIYVPNDGVWSLMTWHRKTASYPAYVTGDGAKEPIMFDLGYRWTSCEAEIAQYKAAHP